MSSELIAVIVVGLSHAAARALLWGLHRGVVDLCGRMAQPEGWFEGLTRREPSAVGTGTA